MACLVYYGKQVKINKILTIGRVETNDLYIKEKTVSKEHAVIKELEEKYFLIDVGSTNGTFLNHKKINIPTELTSGDLIQFGNVQVVFNQADENDDDDRTLLANDDYIVNSIVLVSDIKGYTRFSEVVPIVVVKSYMSNWVKGISKIIQNNLGFVDKIIGDCLYARWDTQVDSTHVKLALSSIFQIHLLTKKLNKQFLDEYDYNLSIGAAIHVGEVILGDSDFLPSGISDTVNTTFRLESYTREFGADLILSNDAYSILDTPIINEEDSIQLKGKKDLISIHKINFNDLEEITEVNTEFLTNV